MNRLLFFAGLACVILFPSLISHAQNSATNTTNSRQTAWTALADEYFDQVYFKFNPTYGTSAGLHQYDPLLEDYSRAGVDNQVKALQDFEKRVEAFSPKG